MSCDPVPAPRGSFSRNPAPPGTSRPTVGPRAERRSSESRDRFGTTARASTCMTPMAASPMSVLVTRPAWHTAPQPGIILSPVQELEPDLRPHAERVAELDVEVPERLEEPGVLERACI